MRANKKIIFLLLLFPTLAGLGLLSSCSASKGPIEIVLPAVGAPEKPQSNNIEKRFQKSTPQGPTAVETAIELSQKHAELSEQAALLRQKNQKLTDQNNRLEKLLADSKTQLAQTQKELTEANDLLIEMTIELNNWKTNILGFQDEIRKADTAQLQALLKILKVLGGEVNAESDQSQHADLTRPNTGELQQSQAQKLRDLTLGESND